MKIRHVLFLFLTIIVVGFGGLVYLGHTSSQPIEKTSESQSSGSSSIVDKTYQETSTSALVGDDIETKSTTNTADSVVIGQPNVEEHKASNDSGKQSSSISIIDDGYNYVLNFSDGTRRLTNAAPAGKYWQQGTSSAAYGNHLGRTNFNQIKPNDSNELKSFETDTQQKMNSSKPFSN